MRPDARRAVVGAVLLCLVLCLSGCAGLLAVNYAAAGVPLPPGYVIQLCVGVNTAPSLRIGVAWIAPYMSALPPVLLQNPLCAIIPWLPFLPPRGGFSFPP